MTTDRRGDGDTGRAGDDAAGRDGPDGWDAAAWEQYSAEKESAYAELNDTVF